MVIKANTTFVAITLADFPEIDNVRTFQVSSRSTLSIEPAGRMAMPVCHISNRSSGEYRVHEPLQGRQDGRFPDVIKFPKMVIAQLDNAYCLPFAPPFLTDTRHLITEFLVPRAPGSLAWFSYAGEGIYHINLDLEIENLQYDFDTAFYLDHSISGHYGHFIGDCLCRMYAWEVCQSLFGSMKIIIANGSQTEYQTHLLTAAGVPAREIVRIDGLVHCRRLLLATQSFGVQHYASSASARLWGTIRDRSAGRDVRLPERIYLSRTGVKDRKLANEDEVEKIFTRHNFTIIHPETLRVETQLALVANALLIAGPSGSGMFNLAFQGRLRSALILVWEHFVQLSEALFTVNRGCELWYHIGKSAPPEISVEERGLWIVDLAELESDVADWLASVS
jgi:hypothetical protein